MPTSLATTNMWLQIILKLGLNFCGVAEHIVASIAGSSSETFPKVDDTAYVKSVSLRSSKILTTFPVMLTSHE